MPDLTDIRERIRASLPMAELLGRLNIPARRTGSRIIAHCPFHEEKTPSFSTGGRYPDRGHCFGCGWDGDIFTFWMERHSVDFKTAIAQLAGECGIPLPHHHSTPTTAPPAAPPPLDEAPSDKPPLPHLRVLKQSEVQQLALVRHLSFEGVACAAWRFRRIGFADWPQFKHGREFRTVSGLAHPSWCITDATRNTAEFRRLDGGKYDLHDGRQIKAWSTKGKSWPIGAAELAERRNVILVEGGPDLLAAYHFLHRFGMLGTVGVVCMLGASNRIREDALPHFKGARVRIMMDDDAAGLTAAGKWTAQLTSAGAAVETFTITGLATNDGRPVKDLNDLALCEDSVIDAPDIADAFLEWRKDFGG